MGLLVPVGCRCRWWTDRWMDRWPLCAAASPGLRVKPPALLAGCLPCLCPCLSWSQAADTTGLSCTARPDSRYPGSFLASDCSSWLLPPQMAAHPVARMRAGGF